MKKRKMELEGYNIIKIDIDFKPSEDWLKDWIETRKLILEYLNIGVYKVNKHESYNGLHFWFHLDKEIDYNTMLKLQFLLGDDHGRIWFGLQREGFIRFRSKFNMLFGKKYKVENGKVMEYEA
jgi:hypothetical protein